MLHRYIQSLGMKKCWYCGELVWFFDSLRNPKTGRLIPATAYRAPHKCKCSYKKRISIKERAEKAFVTTIETTCTNNPSKYANYNWY